MLLLNWTVLSRSFTGALRNTPPPRSSRPGSCFSIIWNNLGRAIPYKDLVAAEMDLKAEPEEDDCPRPTTLDVFAGTSTLHGLAHIFTYERFGVKRLLWLLLFLGSFSLLLCVCVDRVRYYFAYPHVTKLDEVSVPRMVFPAITFCNLNEFRFSRVTRNDLYHAGELLALLNNRWVVQWGRQGGRERERQADRDTLSQGCSADSC